MAITILDDVILPNSVIAAGVRGKNMRLNSRVTTDSGAQAVNVIWTQTLRQYEIGIAPMNVEQWQAIEAIHEITEGGAFGFLMQDPKDNHVNEGGIFELIDPPPPDSAPGVAYYQMVKRYVDPASGRSKDRKITRPKGAILVYENGVLTAASVSPLDGIATVAGSPDAETITWAGSFYVPVHFVDDSIDWELVTGGPAGSRFLAGPSLLLQEVRE
jgi:uncharacterized protein (TIGR02217 family)